MLLVFPVRACDVIAARSDQLFHERIEGSHLCGRVRQLIRHDGGNGRPFEVSADRFCQQAAVLGDFRCHQFPCPFDLVQVLHRSLRVRQVFQHFVLDAVDTVEGHRYGGFCGYDTLLEFPPLLVDAFQFRCLCHNRCGQGRVSLLGEDGNAPCAQSQQDGKSRQSLFDED